MNVSNLVKAKSPEASVSKISVVCDSIKCPLGGGDNEDEKEGHIQPPFASGASDILSFTVGFTASSEMLSSAETPKRKTSNQDLHLNSQISPRCISPKTLKSNASVSNKSSLTSFSESKNESLAWMELEDLKNYHSEVSEYNLRPRHYREVNADKPLLTGVEPPSDGSSYCVINEERFSKSPVNKSFQGVGSANPGIGDYFREDVRPTTQFQVDHRSGYDESTTSYARLSAHNFETYPTTTDNSGFNSKNVFSRQNRPFNAELTGFNTNTTVFDGSHSQYEIKPLDALELQAERDFGNIYGDKRHKTTERPGWSLWKQDSRDMAAELSSAENVTNTQGQVTSPYHRPMRMATGYNVDHDVRATDTEHTAYESYFANNPISNYSFASERPYAEYAHNQGYKLGTDAGARLSAPSWSDYASSSMTRSVRTPAAPYYSRQDHPENCQSANIPWDQLAAPVSTALDPRSLTALESDRRSLGYSYLTPIQEESEEDQRDGGH
ncbi:hypothetical protein EGW08_012874 [Elysia chlorotica]|uniref:Uncharacterized protein n=1 Tax=Elysia chlorotica TaxID=188477 RepID=A0A433TCW0_ELYCH|nr:hypothetical protein EGW08_012874 [Elysia chlorotica]